MYKGKVRRDSGPQQDKALVAKHLHASKTSRILHLAIVHLTLYFLSISHLPS